MNYVPHKAGQDWALVLSEKLWRNQQGALKAVEAYLQSDSVRQCMVRMPTGTGKTAVMGVLAQLLENYRRILVIAPWDHLADQLMREIAEKFWQKAQLMEAFTARPVRHFTPATLAALRAEVEPAGVLICTQSTLETLHREGGKKYASLRDWADLVLVDEGHREPAPKWAQAVRNLEHKTVLFTATPYRNDSKLFEFDPVHTFAYTFPQAVADRVIREVKFSPAGWQRRNAREYSSFARTLVTFRRDAAKSLKVEPETLRTVVRCERREDVEEVVRALAQLGQKVIGVHERFTHGAQQGRLYRAVPDPATEPAEFWVHQYKLMEGLDDPRFRILALFSGFQNGRNLVQQVGRIIRNPGHQPDQAAFVLSHLQDRQEVQWVGFIAYEQGVQRRLDGGRQEAAVMELFREARELTRSFYVQGQFRKHLMAAEVNNPAAIVRMKRSVLVLQAIRDVTFGQLIQRIEDDIVARDAVFFGDAMRTRDAYLRLYETMQSSEAASELYLETKIAYVYVRYSGGRLYYTDSEDALADFVRENFEPIALEKLARMFPDGTSTIGEISLLNGDLGNYAFRRKSLATGSLAVVPPGLSDYHHVCTTAVGRVELKEQVVRRYVGFTRGRIVERDVKPVEYAVFRAWLDQIDTWLDDDKVEGVESLDRYAEAAKYDGRGPMRHVLFDVDFEALDAGNLAGMNPPANPADLWSVENSGRFVGEIAGRYFQAQVKWNKRRRLFLFESDDLDLISFIDPESGKVSTLLNYLNGTQRFRALVGDSRELIYTQRRFFRPNANPWLGGRRRFDLINIIHAVPLLDASETEKGGKGDPVWPLTSVFGALTRNLRADGVFVQAKWQPDILLCNDIAAPEIADFLAISENPRRLVQIHCKVARDGARMSASSFHDLCSQAVRYLAFFNPNDEKTKVRAANIEKDWAIDDRQRERLIINNEGLKPVEVAARIDRLVRDPACIREVWMVMGQGLSRGDLEAAITPGASPAIHERHMVYLLQATWSTIATVGAALKVFCRT